MIPVGVAVRQVEIPEGTPMAGFAARTESSLGVLDPVTTRALLIGDVAIVAVDVCALHEATCARVREETAHLGVDCIVTATHTHSGPCCARGRLGPDRPEVERAIIDSAIDAVSAARAEAQPCTLTFGRSWGTGVAHDRRAGRPVDPPVSVLTASRADGDVYARLVHFPCHPVVMDASNLLISGDYPAFLRTELDRDGGCTVFVTGCAGDVNTGHSIGDSYTPGTSGARTPDEAARIGSVLADAVRRAESSAVADAVRSAHTPVTLPIAVRDDASIRSERRDLLAQRDAVLRDPPADAASALAMVDTWIRWTDGALADVAPQPEWTGRVSAIDLGPLLLVALPGEPFLATGRRIEERLADLAPNTPRAVVVLGYADGVPGYVPPAEAYPDGGYEVELAYEYYAMPGPFPRGCAEDLEDAAVRAAQEAARESPACGEGHVADNE